MLFGFGELRAEGLRCHLLGLEDDAGQAGAYAQQEGAAFLGRKRDQKGASDDGTEARKSKPENIGECGGFTRTWGEPPVLVSWAILNQSLGYRDEEI